MRVVVAVALAVLVSGCSDPGNSKGSGDAELPTDVPPVLDFAFEVSGCKEVTLVLFVDFAQADKTTPTGFTAADASVLLGLPAPLGMGAVLLTNAICETASNDPNGYAEGAIAVLVEDPGVPGVDAAPYNFYESALVIPNGTVRDGLAAAGWNLVGESVWSLVDSVGPVWVGSGIVARGGEDDSFFYSVLGQPAAAGPTMTGTFRWWQKVPTGLGYLDYTFTAQAYFGPGDCIIPSGPAGDAAGIGACGPTDAVVGTLPDFTGSVEFHHLPGVTLG